MNNQDLKTWLFNHKQEIIVASKLLLILAVFVSIVVIAPGVFASPDFEFEYIKFENDLDKNVTVIKNDENIRRFTGLEFQPYRIYFKIKKNLNEDVDNCKLFFNYDHNNTDFDVFILNENQTNFLNENGFIGFSGRFPSLSEEKEDTGGNFHFECGNYSVKSDFIIIELMDFRDYVQYIGIPNQQYRIANITADAYEDGARIQRDGQILGAIIGFMSAILIVLIRDKFTSSSK